MKCLFLGLVVSFSVMASDKVVYGVDGRMELNRTPFSSLVNSVAGMVDSYKLEKLEDGYKVRNFRRMDTYRGVPTCEDLRFREQATVPSCTGFLVAEDILVTAGHCVTNPGRTVHNEVTSACMNYKWVFSFDNNAEVDGEIKFAKEDVVGCKEVIAASYTNSLDFAVVRLDRKLKDKKPVKISSDVSNYKDEERIFVVGHPTGLPLKLSAGATVKKEDENNFITNLDTFAGNSGSPIFNFYGEAIGILVSGETDYRYDNERQCVTVNVCTDVDGSCDQSYYGKAMGETGTKIKFVEYVLKREKEKEEKKNQVK